MVAVRATTSPLVECVVNGSDGSECAAFAQPAVSNDTALPRSDGHNRAGNDLVISAGVQATMQRDGAVHSLPSTSTARRNLQRVFSGTPFHALRNSQRDAAVTTAPSGAPPPTTLSNRCRGAAVTSSPSSNHGPTSLSNNRRDAAVFSAPAVSPAA